MRLRIKAFGESAEGIELSGNPKSGEPPHVRISFPGGDVEVVRATDGANPDYWVHVRINRPEAGMDVPGETMHAQLVDARLDQHGKHSAESNLGDFKSPSLYHVALRVKPTWEEFA
jgi:hypothetical protein